MKAANPMCRLLLLAVGLAAVVGCKSDDGGTKARGQIPQDPLAPIAPPPPPGIVGATGPLAPIAPPGAAVPFNPLPPPGPSGVVPAVLGSVQGLPVDAPGSVVPVGVVAGKRFATAAEMLKAGVPQVRVVAVVGTNNVITDQEVRESVWQQNSELAKLDGRARKEKERELYTVALKKTIERELILDEMYTKLKKSNKPSVIEDLKTEAAQSADRRIRDHKKQLGIRTDDDFNSFLRSQGLTLAVFRRQLERQFMAEMYVNSLMKETGRHVGLTEIRDYYDKHPNEFKSSERVRWQHVFVSFAKCPTQQAAYQRAEEIRKRAAVGEDFGALSRQFDNGTAGNQGGFGLGEKRGELLPSDVAPVVWSLKLGEVSGLVQTPTGYHIVKVVERDYETVLPFDSKVQTKIRNKLDEELAEINSKKMIDDLWRKGVVRVLQE